MNDAELRRILHQLTLDPILARWVIAGGADDRALRLAKRQDLCETQRNDQQWTVWVITSQGREWLAQWEKCPLCGYPTAAQVGAEDATEYPCPNCRATQETDR